MQSTIQSTAAVAAPPTTMTSHVYNGPGRHSWEDVPKPQVIDASDAIVRVDAVTICGTDLHILKGDVPETTPGTILGHTINGTQAEFVRMPFADHSLYKLPDKVHSEDAQMLADIAADTGALKVALFRT